MIFNTLGVFTDVYGKDATLDIHNMGKVLLISLIGFMVVFIVLGIIALFVKALGKGFDAIEANKKKKAVPVTVAAPVSVPAVSTPSETPVKAEVKLIDVTDEQAAMIMAIVSNQSGIPLSHLKFNSIKPAEDK